MSVRLLQKHKADYFLFADKAGNQRERWEGDECDSTGDCSADCWPSGSLRVRVHWRWSHDVLGQRPSTVAETAEHSRRTYTGMHHFVLKLV